MNEKERYIVTGINKYSKLKNEQIKDMIIYGIATTLSVLGLAKGVTTHFCTSELHVGDIINMLCLSSSALNFGIFSSCFGRYYAYKDEEQDSRQDFIETFDGRAR